jgi:hypothetical protein
VEQISWDELQSAHRLKDLSQKVVLFAKPEGEIPILPQRHFWQNLTPLIASAFPPWSSLVSGKPSFMLETTSLASVSAVEWEAMQIASIVANTQRAVPTFWQDGLLASSLVLTFLLLGLSSLRLLTLGWWSLALIFFVASIFGAGLLGTCRRGDGACDDSPQPQTAGDQ